MMSIEWNKSAVEILIKSYKAKECLWNVKNPYYRNKVARRSALQQVVSEVEVMKEGVNANEITRKFNTLRTQYLAEVKKIGASESSGCAASEVYKPTVWWFSHMNFLRCVLQRRRVVSNLHEEQSAHEESPQLLEVHLVETDDEDDDSAAHAMNLHLHGSQVAAEPLALSPSSQLLSGASSPQNEYEDDDIMVTPTPKRVVKKKFHSDPSVIGVSRMLESIGKAFSKQKPSDEASQFGEFIASKLRRIDSAALRLSTEHEIMNVVMKAELQNLDLKLEAQNEQQLQEYCQGNPTYKITSVGH